MLRFETEYYNVTCESSQEVKDLIFNKLIEFYRKIDMYDGYGLFQCDELHLEAPSLLCEFADKILKFQVEDRN